MKIAMAQMSMTDDINKNLEKFLSFCDKAKDCNLLFFPEIQLTPFFPQYPNRDVAHYCLNEASLQIECFKEKAREHGLFLSPNIYMEYNGSRYDTSLWITPKGEIAGASKMVHIAQAKQFYEQDYYTPSNDGFKVFDTEYGKVGIVICYDRHLPESIRTCTLMGAELIIIPTANTKAEPLEMFEWEIRVQAMQNQVFIAMCNRVGVEGSMEFAGESIVVDPMGNVLTKADHTEQLVVCSVDLEKSALLKKQVPYLGTRRPQWYL